MFKKGDVVFAIPHNNEMHHLLRRGNKYTITGHCGMGYDCCVKLKAISEDVPSHYLELSRIKRIVKHSLPG